MPVQVREGIVLESELLGRQAEGVMKARLEVRKREAKAREKEARQHKAYRDRVERAADAVEEAEANAAKAPPLDPVAALEARLNTDRENREAITRGDWQRVPEWEMIKRQDVRACLAKRKEQRRQDREAELGLPEAQRRWAKSQDAIGANAGKERAAEEQRHADALVTIRDREADELERLGPQPSIEQLEAQKVEAPA